MKLTKEVVRFFKYHGFITITVPDEDIVKHYKTVNELADAGFINDPEAFQLAESVFTDEGTPAIGPTRDEDVTPDEVEGEGISDEAEVVESESEIVSEHMVEELETKLDPVDETETVMKPVDEVETVAELETKLDPVDETETVMKLVDETETVMKPVDEVETVEELEPVDETETVMKPEPEKEPEIKALKKRTTNKKTTKKES